MPYYAVVNGRCPGIYDDWDDCQDQVNGYSGQNYRRFTYIRDARQYLFDHGVYRFPEHTDWDQEQDCSSYENVYIDGACRGNGVYAMPAAGIGIFYGDNDSRNRAIGLHALEKGSVKPTNQRAELHALVYVLKETLDDIYDDVNCETKIYSDSRYVIDCMKRWVQRWRSNGWTNARGDTVANKDLISKAADTLDQINHIYNLRGWSDLRFFYVPGHSGHYGNEEADRLANAGATEMQRHLKMTYYAVVNGHCPGIYDDWGDCQEQVNGYSRHNYRRFDDVEDARQYLYDHGNYSFPEYIDDSDSEDGMSYEDDSDSEVECLCYDNVYIDGACRGNGVLSWPAAGIGIFYGDNDSRNGAIGLNALDDVKPTNQRAELHALLYALRETLDNIHIDNTCETKIYTDSRYVIDCMNKWVDRWRSNGWVNARGMPVVNGDLISKAAEILDEINYIYDRRGWPDLRFFYVPGHSGHYGNEEADRLANEGADQMEMSYF
ncbi:Ribonuclease H [Spathaspora sp. JA1]|nr:Ribonuclease H [Spathaspora sp. JA1]